MFESSISNLLSAWGDTAQETEAKTLSGLISALEALPKDPDKLDLIKSDAPTLLLAIQQALRETEQDVSRLPEHSPLLDIFQIALSGYDQAEELLQEIVSDETPLAQEAESILEDLRMAQGELKRSQELWARWMASASPRCSCCGYESSRESECPDCGCDLLLADTRPNESRNRRQAVLGPEYNNAYGAYLKLQDGKVKLSHFHQTLTPIQRNANNWRAILRQIPPSTLPEESYQTLVDAIEQTSQGINLISGALETRRWSHINDGWNSIFQAAADIQQQLPTLYRALGSEADAVKLEQDMRVRDLA
jgi:predicted Zn-ribbon and HTH transcriptional regulator